MYIKTNKNTQYHPETLVGVLSKSPQMLRFLFLHTQHIWVLATTQYHKIRDKKWRICVHNIIPLYHLCTSAGSVLAVTTSDVISYRNIGGLIQFDILTFDR